MPTWVILGAPQGCQFGSCRTVLRIRLLEGAKTLNSLNVAHLSPHVRTCVQSLDMLTMVSASAALASPGWNRCRAKVTERAFSRAARSPGLAAANTRSWRRRTTTSGPLAPRRTPVTFDRRDAYGPPCVRLRARRPDDPHRAPGGTNRSSATAGDLHPSIEGARSLAGPATSSQRRSARAFATSGVLIVVDLTSTRSTSTGRAVDRSS